MALYNTHTTILITIKIKSNRNCLQLNNYIKTQDRQNNYRGIKLSTCAFGSYYNPMITELITVSSDTKILNYSGHIYLFVQISVEIHCRNFLRN